MFIHNCNKDAIRYCIQSVNREILVPGQNKEQLWLYQILDQMTGTSKSKVGEDLT